MPSSRIAPASSTHILPRHDLNATNDTWEQLPADLRGMVEAQLAGGRDAAGLARTGPGRPSALRPRTAGSDRPAVDRRGPAELAETAGRGARRPCRSTIGRWRRSRASARRSRPASAPWICGERRVCLANGGIRSAGRRRRTGWSIGSSVFARASWRRRRSRRAADHGLSELRGDPGGRPEDLSRLRSGQGQAGHRCALPAGRALPSRTSGWSCWDSC